MKRNDPDPRVDFESLLQDLNQLLVLPLGEAPVNLYGVVPTTLETSRRGSEGEKLRVTGVCR